MNSAPRQAEVEVRELVGPQEMADCVTLYESVFRLGPGDGSLNARLLVALAHNSGIVIGAYDGGRLVGFTFSFLARDDLSLALYEYSQIAAVDHDWQGAGIGRRLKLAQRRVALARGIDEIRWAFDPLQIRNAHFNLDVLGARAGQLVRDLYGEYGHGLDARTSTHRVIAVWSLDSPVVAELAAAARPTATDLISDESLGVGSLVREGEGALLCVPATFGHSPTIEETSDRERVLDTMESLFEEGLEAVSCRRSTDERAVYRFEPR